MQRCFKGGRVRHRHLNHEGFTLAAIDDVIARGRRENWAAFRAAARADRTLFKKIIKICRPRLVDPYAQRYHFWYYYARQNLS